MDCHPLVDPEDRHGGHHERAAFLELWPFTQGELDSALDAFLATAFRSPGDLLDGDASRLTTEDYFDRLCAGGFRGRGMNTSTAAKPYPTIARQGLERPRRYQHTRHFSPSPADPIPQPTRP